MGIFDDFSVHFRLIIPSIFPISQRFTALPQARGMVRLSVQALEDPEIHLSERVRMWGLEVARRQVQIYQEMSR